MVLYVCMIRFVMVHNVKKNEIERYGTSTGSGSGTGSYERTYLKYI